MTTVREAAFSLFREAGMTTIFGNPGSTEMPMFREFPSDFRYILGLQESVVLGMADGYAQATRNAALVNLHSSAGVGHALGNLFTAYKNQTPLVVTAGQQTRSLLPFDPFLYAERPTEFPRPFIKWACEPARAQDVPTALARAYHVAMEPPQGPVFVSIPIDDWDEPCDPIALRKVTSLNPGDPVHLARIAAQLADARHPTIVVGAGVARDRAWDEVIALAEAHEALVWASPYSARNGFPEDHRLFSGFLPAFREPLVRMLEPFDYVLVLGGPLSLYHADGTGPHVAPDTRVAIITDNPSVAGSAPVGEAVLANVKCACATLLQAAAPPVRQNAGMCRTAIPPLDGSFFDDRYLLQELARVRPRDSIIVEEAPTTRGPMHDYLPILAPDTFYTCASGGLGHGLPAAVGIALARPQEKVIALVGDGSSMYSIQALHAAAQHRLPITFLIVRNGTYEGLIEFGKIFAIEQPVGTVLDGLDYRALAAGLGVKAVRATDPDELHRALAWTLAANEPTLVEVVVQRR